MKKPLRVGILWLSLTLIAPGSLFAGATMPEPGSKDRREIMDTLRELPEAKEHAEDAGGKIVFKVNKLLLEDDVALADVIPCTEDLKKSYPGLMVFLRRGGDEPWAVVANGPSADAKKSVDGWVKQFLASDDGEDFLNLWSDYQPDPGPKNTADAEVLAKGNADRAAILKVIHAFSFIKDMEKELGKKILFEEVVVKKSGNWAWFEGNPGTEDKTWQGESVAQLLNKQKGSWKAITGIPEEVITADDSDAAYTRWRKGLLKKYPDLSAELVPLQ